MKLQPCRFQPGSVRHSPVAVTGADQDVSPEASPCRSAQLGGALIVPAVEQRRRLRHPRQHGECVDLDRIDRESVTAVTAHDRVRIAERSPQPDDLRLQGVAPGVDGIGAPQVVDQPIGHGRGHRHRARVGPAARTLLPAGRGTSRPARRTSTGPSTEIANTVRVYESVSAPPSAVPARHRTRSTQR